MFSEVNWNSAREAKKVSSNGIKHLLTSYKSPFSALFSDQRIFVLSATVLLFHQPIAECLQVEFVLPVAIDGLFPGVGEQCQRIGENIGALKLNLLKFEQKV